MNRKGTKHQPLGCISSNRGCIKLGRPASSADSKHQYPKQHLPVHRVRKAHRSDVRKELVSHSLPETDPIVTGSLWTAVSKKNMENTRHPRRRGAAESLGSRLPLRSTRAASDVESVSESNSSSRPRALRPQQSSDFKLRILAPRYITINAKARITRGPFMHFGTQRPASYKALGQLGAASVLLDLPKGQEKKIAAHYDFMRAKRLCEAEFSTYAIEPFFLGEQRCITPAEDRLWRAERMLQLICPPSSDAHWLKPPLIEEDVARSDDYSWDVRPDCAYWISTRGFNDEYVHNVKGACFVHQGWVLCPYLTIEFKRDSDDISAAQTQAVTAGAIALYNRFMLHSQARLEADDNATLTNLVHYTITFTGPSYTIWQIYPSDLRETNTWNGCCMRFLDQGDCTRTFDVNRLVEWINEIHRWGLSIHAPACETDVKHVLNGGGVDTSAIA